MLNDYIIITWSPLTVFLCFLHVSFLIKHSLAKVSHRQKAGRGFGGGRGSRTIEFCSISTSVGVGGEGVILWLKYLSLSFLKSLTVSWAEVWKEKWERKLECGFKSHYHFPEIPKLLVRTVLVLWDPLTTAIGAFTQCVPVSADRTWRTNGPCHRVF